MVKKVKRYEIVKRKKIYLGSVLVLLGLLGMITMIKMDIPLPQDMEAILLESFTQEQIKWLILINPSILLILCVVVGTILYHRVNLNVPIIEKLVGINKEPINIVEITKSGSIGGVIAGILVVTIVLIFKPFMIDEYAQLTKSVKPTLANRLLYGGITEEIFLRFGLMTLIVWICAKIFKRQTSIIYWIGIFLSALLFAFGHFPVVFNSIETPSMVLLLYVLLGNTIGGLIFGWLYWQKGLESAFIAHMFTHIVLLSAENTIF